MSEEKIMSQSAPESAVTPRPQPAQKKTPAKNAPARRSWFPRPPSPFSRPVTRFRTAVVVGPLMAGLVVAGAFGARMMYADPEPASALGPDVTCWDRTLAPADQCTLPTGVEGLAWVYPSFDPQDDSCVDVLLAHPEYRRPTMWSCESDLHGRPLRVTYSELTGLETGLAYHEKLFADGKKSAFPGPHGTVDHYVWRLPEPVDGMYRMAAMYVDVPYAVLIEGSTLRDRDRAYRDLVHQRDPRHVTTRFS